MFGGGPGPLGRPSVGRSVGGNPFQVPVIVLTHHPREPLVLHGDPPFTFVTEGISAALAMAEKAAPGKDVTVGGGASAAKQYLAVVRVGSRRRCERTAAARLAVTFAWARLLSPDRRES